MSSTTPTGTDTSRAEHGLSGSHRTTVLIAVDRASRCERIVRTAYQLFGEHAEYLTINVGPGPYSDFSWAYVSPAAGPMGWPTTRSEERLEEEMRQVVTEARDLARRVADDGGLVQATPLGEVGDAATAILRAAHEHHADVIVVGEHHRGWFGRLFTGSVERTLLRDADVSVLVVADTSPNERRDPSGPSDPSDPSSERSNESESN